MYNQSSQHDSHSPAISKVKTIRESCGPAGLHPLDYLACIGTSTVGIIGSNVEKPFMPMEKMSMSTTVEVLDRRLERLLRSASSGGFITKLQRHNSYAA